MYLSESCKQNDVKEEQIRQIEQVVAGAGWLDNSPDGIDKLDPTGITPTINNSGSQWCSLIQQIWKGILAESLKNIPAGPIKSFDELYGTDKIVIDTMTSYLSRKFILDQPGAINVLESVIQTFKLNSEQEQGFRIVEFFTLLHVFLQESRGILSFLCQNS